MPSSRRRCTQPVLLRFTFLSTIPLSKNSKYEPDSSFWHDDAEYPGVIIEVSYSQKKVVGRLAEGYLLDSDASVQVVVGLDIEYGKKGSRQATLSVWRTRVFHFDDGDELRVVQEIADEVCLILDKVLSPLIFWHFSQAFRDDQGDPTNYPGLHLQLRDFANEELTQGEVEDQELSISTQQLCEYLTAAETKVQQRESLSKQYRSQTPPEIIASVDEAKYTEREQRAVNRSSDDDSDYQDTSSASNSPDEKHKL